MDTVIDINETSSLLNNNDTNILITTEQSINVTNDAKKWNEYSICGKIFVTLIALPVYCVMDVLPMALKFMFISLPLWLCLNIPFYVNKIIIEPLKQLFNLIFIAIPILIHKKIVIPLAVLTVKLFILAFIEIPKYVYDNWIFPTFMHLYTEIKFILSDILFPMLLGIVTAISKIFAMVVIFTKNTILLMVDCIKNIWNNILYTLQEIHNVIHTIARLLYFTIIYPLWTLIVQICGDIFALLKIIFVTIPTELLEITKVIFLEIVKPILEFFVITIPTLLYKTIIIHVLLLIRDAIKFIFVDVPQYIVTGVRLSIKFVIKPALLFVFYKILVPIYNFIKYIIILCASIIKNVVLATIEFIKNAVALIKDIILQAIEQIKSFITMIKDNIINPAILLVRDGITNIRNGFQLVVPNN